MSFLRGTLLLVVLAGLIGGLGYFKFIQISAAIAQGEAYPEHSESVEATEAAFAEFAPTTRVSGEVVVPYRVVLRSQHAGQFA